MSTNTQVRFSIPKPPPLKVVRGQNILNLNSVLGENGCELLRQTLERSLSEQERTGRKQVLDWQRVPNQTHVYQTKVGGSEVTLRLQGVVAEIAYEGRTKAENQANIKKNVNRKVNELLTVTMANRISQRLTTERIGMKQTQRIAKRIEQRLVNRNMVRISAQIRQRV